MLQLIPLLTMVGEAVVNRYVTSDKARGLVSFGFDLLESGVNVNTRLENYAKFVEKKVAEAALQGQEWEPTDADFQALWAKINARDSVWDAIPD